MIYANTTLDSNDVAQHYDELDHLYRNVWGEHLHHGLWREGNEPIEEAVEALVSQVAQIAGIQPHQDVCDVGCGYGATSRLLADKWGANVTGITVSKSQFSYIQSRSYFSRNTRFALMDWLSNCLPNQSFDHVISIESSEHMTDKLQFFNEAYRVLRPGGKLVICAWLACEHPTLADTKFFLEPICREGRLPSIGSESDYKSLYALSGFKFESFLDLSSGVKKTWRLALTKFLHHLSRKPEDLKFLFPQANSNADFLKSVFRMLIGYEIGTIRYGIFCGTKSPQVN